MGPGSPLHCSHVALPVLLSTLSSHRQRSGASQGYPAQSFSQPVLEMSPGIQEVVSLCLQVKQSVLCSEII